MPPPAGHEGIAGVVIDSDGNRLLGRLYLAAGAAPRPTALLLHGCPGLELNLDLAAALRDHGWNSLVFHYRGCWGSEGRYDLRTIPRDVSAAIDYLQAGGHPSVDGGRLAVVGHSLGGWAAIVSAAQDERLRAVAVYGSAADLGALEWAPAQVEREMTRFLAATPEEFIRQRDDVARRRSALAAVAAISPRPLLIVHSADDPWAPVEQARLLRERAREPCRYVEVDGAGHDFAGWRRALRTLLIDWLDQTNA